MSGLFIGLAVVLAVAALGYRRWRRARDQARRPGATMARAIPVERFDEMETFLGRRRCICGKTLQFTGEGSREFEGRRFRIAHLVCSECEREERVFFDVTQAFH